MVRLKMFQVGTFGGLVRLTAPSLMSDSRCSNWNIRANFWASLKTGTIFLMFQLEHWSKFAGNICINLRRYHYGQINFSLSM